MRVLASRRARVLVAGLGLGICGGLPVRAPSELAAQAASTESPERIHPEMVDKTWGTRTRAAWERAWARDWDSARTAFGVLRRQQPAAVEPRLGMAFVARGQGRLAEARRWYRLALDAEPSNADIARQLEVAEWDRPGRVELSGVSTRVNGARAADWSAAMVVPITPRASITGRLGELGTGDPLRGIFFDPATGGTGATFVGAGVVARLSDRFTGAARIERWSSAGAAEEFAWVDAAWRLTDRLTVHALGRPLGGNTGAAQLGVAADVRVAGTQVASAEITHGVRAAPFEGRTQVRLFYEAAPDYRWVIRGGVIRDIDPRLAATTETLALSRYLSPYFGARVEAVNRTGAYARTSAGLSLIVRW